MSQTGEIRSGGRQAGLSPAARPREIPLWTTLLAGAAVLGAVGAALFMAEDERENTVRGFLQKLRDART